MGLALSPMHSGEGKALKVSKSEKELCVQCDWTQWYVPDIILVRVMTLLHTYHSHKAQIHALLLSAALHN
jgi:hypothetical protein